MKRKRRSKFDNNFYCGTHKYIPKLDCIRVQTEKGLIIYRCPFCRKPVRTSPRSSPYKKRSSRTIMIE